MTYIVLLFHSRVRIHMVVPYGLKAGETNRALALASFLAKKHEVFVSIAPQHEYPLYEIPKRPLVVGGTYVIPARYSSIPGIDTVTRSLSASLSAFGKVPQPDVIHAFAPLPTSVITAYLSRKFYSCPWIQDCGDYMAAFTAHLNFFKRSVTAYIEKFAYESSDACIVVSHFLRQLAQMYGSKRVYLIPNGVDCEKIRSLSREVRKEEGRVVYVGTFKKFVDFRTLLETIEMVCSEEADVRFVLVGGGDQLPRVKAWLKERNLLPRVEVKGFLPDHVDVLREILASEIALLPLRDDPRDWARCSMKLVEYLACGCAVVASDVGEARYLAKDAALLVEPENPRAMSEAILSLLHDPSRRRKLQEKARNVGESLDWRVLAGKVEQVYEEVLSS